MLRIPPIPLVLAVALLLGGCGDGTTATRLEQSATPAAAGPTGAGADTVSPGPADDLHTDEPASAFIARQLAELESFATPAGVDADTWRQLRDALRDALSSVDTAARSVRSAPVSDGARTRLTLLPGPPTLARWFYFNPGDYDQNGEVNISDLTPLALHLGEAVPAELGTPRSIQSVIDGDGNGEVNISDVTPIGANFGRRITAYAFYFSSVDDYPAQNSEPSSIAEDSFVGHFEHIGERALERIYFEIDDGLTYYPGLGYWVRPIDTSDDSEGTPSNLLGGDNTAPIARLTASPVAGPAPLTVTLDAGSSSDPDGDALLFFWDTNFDNVFGAADSSIDASYGETGSEIPRVVVEDSGGLQDLQFLQIKIGQPPAWDTANALIAPEDRKLRSIAAGSIGGIPYVLAFSWLAAETRSYCDTAFATDGLGQSWQEPQDVWNSSVDFRDFCDTLVVDSTALAFHARMGSAGFTMMQSSSPYTSGWVFPNLSPYTMTGVPSFSAALLDGTPAVAFHDESQDDLMLMRAQNPGGTVWGQPVDITAASEVGFSASLAIIGGAPAVAFYDAGGGRVRYMNSQFDDVLQDYAWNPPVTVQAVPAARFADALVELADGSPALVYSNPAASTVVFARADGAAGLNFAEKVDIATGYSASTVVPRPILIDGVVHVFFHDGIKSLLYTRATDAAGADWIEPQEVDGDVSNEVLPCPAETGGLPAVAYAKEDQTACRWALYH